MADDDRVPLRDHLETKIAALEKQITLALASSEKAITKAESAADRRFEGVNEFRATLTDQARTFLPIMTFDVQHANLTRRIDTIEKNLNEFKSDTSTTLTLMSGRSSGMGTVVSIAGSSITTIVAIAALLWNLLRH